MRAIIPKTWQKDAERGVVNRNRRDPTRDRNEFKKEVASRLLNNIQQLRENETAHSVFLCSQMATLIFGTQIQWFTEIFEELHAFPEEQSLNLEYYPEAEPMIKQYCLTDKHHRIHLLNNGDLVANHEAKRMMGKLCDMMVTGALAREAMLQSGIVMADCLKISQDKIKCGTFRFQPANQQPWLVGREIIDVLRVTVDKVAMRTGSCINEREWPIILYVYSEFHNILAQIQESTSEAWERNYLRKAVKEDEKHKLTFVFNEVQIQLGNCERICSYHRQHDGNNHKNIHRKYGPCYLHSWKNYEISNLTEGTVSRIPGATVHLNGECKLQQRFSRQLKPGILNLG